MSECLHIIVKGRVQGVYFRAYTQKQAVKLNVKGFVRNLADGSVEIVANGHAEDVQKLVAWCHKGPMLAKVSEVIVNPHNSSEHFELFEIR
ncbi:acylphosphatase [Methylomonas fluvii]|uniref:Acylphosphatase n=1 Tax=Methylomonas fluvii TaxID=1854564 RepID=A0ABR9D7R0_9GAMM|nr:acylphosphatase [Methylomonas fluvii]MBD9359149.1 acylphosphatase [Methylomonas fluvii]CAD6871827.1 Acylphosphatase [Methylomonas fluvii]